MPDARPQVPRSGPLLPMGESGLCLACKVERGESEAMSDGPVVVSVRAPDGAYWLAPGLDEVEVPESVNEGPAVAAYDGGAMINTHCLDDDDRVQLVIFNGPNAKSRLESLRDAWPAYSHATVRSTEALYVVDVESGRLAQVTSGPGVYEVHLIARAKEADWHWRKSPQDPLEDHTLFVWSKGAEREGS
jgi:hypothetical protein